MTNQQIKYLESQARIREISGSIKPGTATIRVSVGSAVVVVRDRSLRLAVAQLESIEDLDRLIAEAQAARETMVKSRKMSEVTCVR